MHSGSYRNSGTTSQGKLSNAFYLVQQQKGRGVVTHTIMYMSRFVSVGDALG